MCRISSIAAMGLTTLILLTIFVGNSYAQTTILDECTFNTCSVTSQPNRNIDGSFGVKIYHLVYEYVIERNTYVGINLKLKVAVVIDGNNGTLYFMKTNTGFAAIGNLHSNLIYFDTKNLQSFDLTTINYSVITSIIEYSRQYTSKVVGDNIDTTQDDYTNTSTLLHNMATTTNYTKWTFLDSNSKAIASLWKNSFAVTCLINKLLNSGNYTEEWGLVMYFIITSEQYQINDKLQLAFTNVMVSIIRTLEGKFTPELIKEYYKLIANQGNQSTEVTLQQYSHLIWAINGVGTTYRTLKEALTSYKKQTVVQTYVSTIIPDSTNISYITYNSMRNGTWLFRIEYGNNQFVQITDSYYDEYLGIYDPSLNYTMVFTDTDQFGFINYKTGNGFVIDGTHNKATYVISNDQNIITAFAEGQYNDGFRLVQKLVDSTELNDKKSFVATDFFVAVQKRDSLDSMLNQKQLDSFNNDFSTLSGKLSDIDFMNSFGISNIAQVMLNDLKTTFFQKGLVQMLSRMFSIEISGGAFYRISYAGILENLHNNFQEELFINTYNVMKYAKKNQSKKEIIRFLESYVKSTTFIDVNSEEFTKDGSVTSKNQRG